MPDKVRLTIDTSDLLILETALWSLKQVDQDDHKPEDIRRLAAMISRHIVRAEAVGGDDV